MSQFSLFGAAAAQPSLDDLDGVLLGGGHWVRHSGTARLSVVVAQPWRADALDAEFTIRAVGAGADAIVAAADGWSVRTAFTAALSEKAARWIRGANDAPPPGFLLTAGGLRLWAIAAGSRDDVGYLLSTDRADATQFEIHTAAGAQLSRRGLAASLTKHGWRITSGRRIRRLAELLGEPPPGGGPHWPDPSG